LLIVAVFTGPVAIAETVDASRLLRAIAQAETGVTDLSRGSRKVGKAGERSAWQMTAATWRSYTNAAFPRASTEPTLAHLVATIHLRHLSARLKEKGRAVSVYNLACAWNAGPSAKHTPHDYATRVSLIYSSLQ
jgi:hypothetical protein